MKTHKKAVAVPLVPVALELSKVVALRCYANKIETLALEKLATQPAKWSDIELIVNTTLKQMQMIQVQLEPGSGCPDGMGKCTNGPCCVECAR
jgi:hypothetical protein